ncbi:MAG: hypothetical protein RLZZ488_2438 [Pseudomonadota bacterium]
MRTNRRKQAIRMTLLSFSSLTLLATVGGCGRNSGGSDQQLLDLAARSSTRLKANSSGVADSLTKRNAEATERLLRGLIDKERDERIAEDKRLSDRIDALELELRTFKEQVEKRFTDVDSRDQVLRLYMEGQFDKLREADSQLASSISDIDKKFAMRIGAAELALKESLKAQNDSLTDLVLAEAGKLRGELADQDAALRAEIAVTNAATLDQLAEAKDELDKKIAQNTADIIANKELMLQKEEALKAAQELLKKDISTNVAALKDSLNVLENSLQQQKAELLDEVAKANARIDSSNKFIADTKSLLEDAANKTKAELVASLNETKTSLQSSIDANAKAIADNKAEQLKVNDSLSKAIAAGNAELTESLNLKAAELAAKIASNSAAIEETKSQLKSTEVALINSISQTKDQMVASLTDQQVAFEAGLAQIKSDLNDTNSNLEIAKSNLQTAIEAASASTSELIRSKVAALESSMTEQKAELQKQIDDNTKAIADNKSAFETKAADLEAKIDANEQKIISTTAALDDFKTQVAQERAALEQAIVDSKNSLAAEMKALIKSTDEANRLEMQKKLDAVAADAKADSNKNAAAIDALKAQSLEIIEEIAKTNSNLEMTNSEIARVKNQMLAKIEEASNKSAADLKAAADGLLTQMAEADAKVRADLEKRIDDASTESADALKAATADITDKMKAESVSTQLKMAALTEQIVKVDTEGKERSANLEKKMAEDIDNIRGEFTAKITALDASVKDARDVLSAKINEGLANVSAAMDSKLVSLEGKISDKLKAEVSAINGSIANLEGKLVETEQKLTTQLNDSMNTLRKESSDALTALNTSLTSKIDAGNANLKAQIDFLVEAQKKAESDAAKQVADLLEKIGQQELANAALDAKLAAASAEQAIALELEKQARAAELKQLSADLTSLNTAQSDARAKLEADLKTALAGQAAASADELANLQGALKEIDKKTLATIDDLKTGLAEERKVTEAAIIASAQAIEKKLADAAIETQKVAARVEAVAQAQEEFKAYVAQNYATKGELLALQTRVSGLEDVTKIMNADMVRSNEEMKTLISKEVEAAKSALTERIQSVEANVADVRDKLGGAIDDYQKQISSIKDNMSKELASVRSDMKTQDDALFASIADNKAKQEAVNADLMLQIKTQAANFETMSQNVKKELSEKIVALESQIDKTNTDLKAEQEAVQKKFAEVVAAEQALKDQMTKEISALKDEIKAVAQIANQSLAMAQQNAEQINLIKADVEAQKEHVAKQFKLTQGQIDGLNTKMDEMKADFNKRLAEVAANAEKLVANLGSEVQENFKKVATDIAQMKAQDKAMESALSSHLVEVVDLKLDEGSMTAFSDGVTSDFSKVTKTIVNGKPTRGPLVTTLELFGEVRKAFLQALQPKMPTRDGAKLTRNEGFDAEFVPIMAACGGRADADFANAFGRDSFDFLADEYVSALINSNRGSNMDAVFFKQPKLSDGSNLHHYVLLEAVRKLEGGADDPNCMSRVKAWATGILNGKSATSKDVRARLAGNDNFKRVVADFAKSVNDLKPSLAAVELRFAKMINNKHTTISQAMVNISNPAEKLGKVSPADAANNLLGKMAFTIADGVDATFDAIQRQEEFDAIVEVQKRFAQNEATDAKQTARINSLDKDVAAMKTQLAQFGKTANDVKSLQDKTGKMEAALSKALDVMLSLAIRSGEPSLVAATKAAGAAMGYAPKEVRPVKPAISEVQHFFAAPALANGSDACTGNSIRRGAGVKFWTAGGQCWVNFRGISSRQWSSAASTIWFRVFGAADKMRVRSNLCDKGANSTCDAEFSYQFSSTAATTSVAGISSKLTGQPVEGVFDFRMPLILDPYIRRSSNFGYGYLDSAWWGEVISFTPFGDGKAGATSAYRVQLYSPIVLDYTNIGRPQFTSIDQSKVRFDLNGDGVTERTGWIGGYGGVGILAMDLNRNGSIDNGLELFGEGTKLVRNGKRARDGYAALAQYDDNGDGMIDAKDAVYSNLLVWFDKNKDGKTGEGEIVPLAETGVTKVSLKHKSLKDAGRFINGNELRTTAKFWGPQECGSQGCNSYDVYFSTAFTTVMKGK